MLPSRAGGIFRKHLFETFWLAERCEDTPYDLRIFARADEVIE
jgi:hypothetical protein